MNTCKLVRSEFKSFQINMKYLSYNFHFWGRKTYQSSRGGHFLVKSWSGRAFSLRVKTPTSTVSLDWHQTCVLYLKKCILLFRKQAMFFIWQAKTKENPWSIIRPRYENELSLGRRRLVAKSHADSSLIRTHSYFLYEEKVRLSSGYLPGCFTTKSSNL